MIPYLLGIYESYKLLKSELTNGPINGRLISKKLSEKKLRISFNDILASLVLTKEFGGFPIIAYPEFLYRGHNDPVTSGLEWLHLVCKHLPALSPIKTWITTSDGVCSHMDFTRLILDPTCLNFTSAGQYSRKVPKILEEGLRDKVKNRELKKLFTIATEVFTEKSCLTIWLRSNHVFREL